MATVARPAFVTLPAVWVGMYLTIKVMTNMHAAISEAPPMSKPRRENLSAKNQLKKVQQITLIAPKRPVNKRARFPELPTMSLKYCGAKAARALLPVVFWKMNIVGPMIKRRRLAGCQSSRMVKLSEAAFFGLEPELGFIEFR